MNDLNRVGAFFLIAVLLAPLATAQLRNPPGSGIRDPHPIFALGDESRMPRRPENDQKRLTVKDFIEEAKNPPKERKMEQGVRPRGAWRNAVDLNRPDLVTIPHWSDSYTYQELTYEYTMVGTDPKRNPATTTIPTIIIPLRFIFEVGTPVEQWCEPIVIGPPGPPVPSGPAPPPQTENCYTRVDDVERRIELEPGNIETILNSPIFKSHPFTVGGVGVGNTQFGDAFQRANFWGSVSNGSQAYHVLLGQPTVKPTIDVFVPRDQTLVALFGNPNPDASIRADFVREAIENAIRQSGVSPQALPIVLYSNRIALSDPWYYMKGYINLSVLQSGFNDVFEVPGGLQTFIASPFFTWGADNIIDRGNVGAFMLSGNILNWINNPFNQNYTPGYDGNVGIIRQCLSDVYLDKLRVGNVVGELPVPPPRPGATPLPVPEQWLPPSYRYDLWPGYAIDTQFGRFSLAHGSFIDAYSRKTRTQSPAGRYGFFDVATVTGQPDPDNPDVLIPVRGADVPILAPAPPCTGHIEVEKQALEYPNAVWTRAYGINNSGTVVGDFRDQSNRRHGFIYDGLNYRQIDFPGASFTIPQAINDRGQIVGAFYDSHGFPHGFLFFQGFFTQIDFPDATDTFVRGINNTGDIVGMYDTTQPVTHGFTIRGSQYRTIDYPVTYQYPESLTDVTGINDGGKMVGFSFDSMAFSLDGSIFTQLPGFCYCAGDITYPRAINNNGQYGGWHREAFHLIYNNNGLFGYATIYGYPHTIYSNGVYGMNDRGKIVGNYFDEDLWRTVGYVADLPR